MSCEPLRTSDQGQRFSPCDTCCDVCRNMNENLAKHLNPSSPILVNRFAILMRGVGILPTFSASNTCMSVSSKRCFRKRRRQQPECVRNAPEMHQKRVRNGSCFIGKRGTSKMRQNCVQNASKMRGTPSGENTFWTIPCMFVMHFLWHCYQSWVGDGIEAARTCDVFFEVLLITMTEIYYVLRNCLGKTWSAWTRSGCSCN